MQLLSDAVHLLSIFTISVMRSWMRDLETETPYSETKLTPKCILNLKRSFGNKFTANGVFISRVMHVNCGIMRFA